MRKLTRDDRRTLRGFGIELALSVTIVFAVTFVLDRAAGLPRIVLAPGLPILFIIAAVFLAVVHHRRNRSL